MNLYTLLQQMNAALASELQETKDKMYKMQNERKVSESHSLCY